MNQAQNPTMFETGSSGDNINFHMCVQELDISSNYVS